MTEPSTWRRLLATALVAYVIVGVFLTPAGGLETRPFSDVTTIGLLSIGLGSVGLIVGVAALVLVFLRPKRASLVAIVGTLLNLPAIFADQFGAFHSVYSPTATITLLELVQLLVVAAVVIFALSSRRTSRVKSRPL